MPPGSFISQFRRRSERTIRGTEICEMPDDILEQIFIRLPPSDPAGLLRAAIVCKAWTRVISRPGFRLLYRNRHGGECLLGFLMNCKNHNDGDLIRYQAAPDAYPLHIGLSDCRALDARHGRVLLRSSSYVAVWDPLADAGRQVPYLPLPLELGAATHWNAALLCAAQGLCEHRRCRSGGPFSVILLAEDISGFTLEFHLYSSVTSSWTAHDKVGSLPEYGIDETVAPVLAEGTVFFTIDSGAKIVGFALATQKSRTLPQPPHSTDQIFSIFSSPEERLGLLSLVRSKISSWVILDGKHWIPTRCVDLDSVFLFSQFRCCCSVLGVVTVVTEDGVYSLENRTLTSISSIIGVYSFVPYMLDSAEFSAYVHQEPPPPDA